MANQSPHYTPVYVGRRWNCSLALAPRDTQKVVTIFGAVRGKQGDVVDYANFDSNDPLHRDRVPRPVSAFVSPPFRRATVIYLVGGAPRAGKSLVGQQIASDLKIGWISTDLLVELLRVKNEQGVKTEWNAAPQAILADAEGFLPYLERFIWGVSSQAENYLIEGVDFLPAQVMELSKKYQIRSVFLG